MALLLGVDTGGTYTDAVLIEEGAGLVAKAKSLTTRRDLALGIGGAIRAVMEESGAAPGDIGLVSLSTTLATNALVEGQGGRVALVSIGFSEADLTRHGLPEALKGEPHIAIPGGHKADGGEQARLDLAALEARLPEIEAAAGAVAVAGIFSVRNPAHESAVRDLVRARTGLPVTCSHELSSKLGGPRRAVTAVLNGRLIAMIDRLIGGAEGLLASLGIEAPLMVVRGDGALVSAAFARARPIETILSGPAASLVGARWLTGADSALVSDIGGTTTDVAVLRDGLPRLDPEGASVGGWKTMVEAVAMRTIGLGGDSEVHLESDGLTPRLRLGPRRAMPLALLGHEHPDLVRETLDRQLRATTLSEYAGRFAVPLLAAPRGLEAREAALFAELADGPVPLDRLLKNRLAAATLDRLVTRGHVIVSALTPTDASHVLGRHDAWDAEASRMGAELFARRRSARGERVAASAEEIAVRVLDQLSEQTVEVLLATALEEDGFSPGYETHELVRAALSRRPGLVDVGVNLTLPVIGLGASAPSYYGAVGERLRAEMVLPEHAGVANAIGAVAGHVRVAVDAVISSPSPGAFRAHLSGGNREFADLDAALAATEGVLRTAAQERAEAAGAEEPKLTVSCDIRTTFADGQEIFIEARLEAVAQGRPRVAR